MIKTDEQIKEGENILIVKPQRLKRGDTVGIISPASSVDLEILGKAIIFLEELGLNIKLGKYIQEEYGYLAGKDEERLEDLHQMFADKKVKAIFCAKGGYGTARIAGGINFDLIKANPKIFWGYSDITFLHQAIQKQTGLVTFHGPMLTSDIAAENVHELTKKSFEQLFQANPFTYSEELSPLHTLVEGEATGQLVGGNLCLITSTLGTKFEIDTKDRILLIEDINEEPRSVDRMLNQLLMAGKLKDVKGILVGDFHNCQPNRDKSLSLEEVIQFYIEKANKPTMNGFKIGHCSPNIAVPLGVNATINTFDKQVFIESGIK